MLKLLADPKKLLFNPKVFTFQNLMLWFQFEQLKAGKVLDWSGNQNDGDVFYCVPTYGLLGSAFSFDGKTSYVEVPDAPSLNPTEEITVEGWFFLKGSTGAIQNGVRKDGQYLIFWIDSDYTAVQVFIQRTDGVWRFLTVTSPTELEGKWTHLAMTYKSNGSFKAYLNGELVNSIMLDPLPIRSTTNPLHLGREPPGYFFYGDIALTRIYNRVLQAAEIKRLYKLGILLCYKI